MMIKTRLLNRKILKRILVISPVVLVALFAAIQLVPYGRDHDNPPVLADAPWDSPRTRELAVRACFDCHSNETHWPWYSNIAPISWITQDNVEEGRDELNFSEWGRRQETDEIVESVEEGEMPPFEYTLRFWSSISGSEKNELIAGLRRTFGDGDSGERERDEDD